jgi:hypothetical protein
MHLQIVEAGERVSRRYVANGSHGVRQCRLAPQKGEPDKRLECCMTIRAWGDATPEDWIMDGNTGRSEGATAEKAVPFPCAVLDPNRSFLEPRVGEPRSGARSALCIFARTSIRPLLPQMSVACSR